MEHVTEGCQCQGKKCSRCPGIQCIGYFGSNRGNKDGLDYYCLVCRNNQVKANYRKHVDKRLAYAKEYRGSHQGEDKKIYQKTYQETHKEQGEARRREWKQRHPGYDKAYTQSHRGQCRINQRKHRQRHHEKLLARNRERYHANPEYFQTYQRNYRRARVEHFREINRVNLQNRRARKKQAGGSYTVAEWLALKAQYDYTCLCCGKREPEIKLTADHVIPITKKGSGYIENIQPLCGPCNNRKGTKIIDFRPKTP